MMMIKPVLRSVAVACNFIRKPDLIVRRTNQQPDTNALKVGELVLVGSKTNPKWAVLRCPGECGLVMRLPLAPTHSPSWSVGDDLFGRASANPSVHQKNACKAHFWIRGGHIVWCRDSGCGHRAED
jgi:uncharacterized protein DUF6527